MGGNRRDGAGRVEINQEHCDTPRCFSAASVPRKESEKKKGKKQKTFDFLCRIAAGAESAEFLSLSCAAGARIAKMVVVVSNRPRVLRKKKTFPPEDCGLGAAEEVGLASCSLNQLRASN